MDAYSSTWSIYEDLLYISYANRRGKKKRYLLDEEFMVFTHIELFSSCAACLPP